MGRRGLKGSHGSQGTEQEEVGAGEGRTALEAGWKVHLRGQGQPWAWGVRGPPAPLEGKVVRRAPSVRAYGTPTLHPDDLVGVSAVMFDRSRQSHNTAVSVSLYLSVSVHLSLPCLPFFISAEPPSFGASQTRGAHT